jgi:hypothetical protein
MNAFPTGGATYQISAHVNFNFPDGAVNKEYAKNVPNLPINPQFHGERPKEFPDDNAVREFLRPSSGGFYQG